MILLGSVKENGSVSHCFTMARHPLFAVAFLAGTCHMCTRGIIMASTICLGCFC